MGGFYSFPRKSTRGKYDCRTATDSTSLGESIVVSATLSISVDARIRRVLTGVDSESWGEHRALHGTGDTILGQLSVDFASL